MKTCAICGTSEMSQHHKAKYCESCQAQAKREKCKRSYRRRVEELLREQMGMLKKEKINPFYLVRGTPTSSNIEYTSITGAGSTY